MMSQSKPETERPMIVFVNGQETQVSAGHTARDLLLDLGFAERPVAVEVNQEVIPRALLADRVLREHDKIEVVTLVGGG
ncbi:MAG: sulfur carrier protein ThiS [Planctomycetota bacterium]|nr:sulfur carrier protein ThiS [Planctomycetota bacterium]|tara:strand:- start:415 stop:651 length:237 start_codon:yes stop_codon:yes gene_type:complete